MQTAAVPGNLDRQSIRDALQDFAVHWRGRIDTWVREGKGHNEKSGSSESRV